MHTNSQNIHHCEHRAQEQCGTIVAMEIECEISNKLDQNQLVILPQHCSAFDTLVRGRTDNLSIGFFEMNEENKRKKEINLIRENDNRRYKKRDIWNKPCISISPFDPNPNWGKFFVEHTKLKGKRNELNR